MARPTIMAGLNQSVMMALAMAVIASMIGARGLGTDVLAGLASLESGRGIVAGGGIVILAVVIDRVTGGLGSPARRRRKPDPTAAHVSEKSPALRS
jgi:ABC-type proline/glycine betaine transport system permease subunit